MLGKAFCLPSLEVLDVAECPDYWALGGEGGVGGWCKVMMTNTTTAGTITNHVRTCLM